MIFASITFFAFLVLFWCVYRGVPCRFQNAVLLIASYLFYICWSWQFALLLMVMTATNYYIGLTIERSSKAKKSLFFLISLLLNAGVFIYFKTAGFFLDDLQQLLVLLGFMDVTQTINLVVPIGLSFYILQCISYQIDVYRKQLLACSDIVAFSLYLAYFAKLTAGPIERAGIFLKQIAKPRVFDIEDITRGFYLIIMGLFKKMVIADTLLISIPAEVTTTPQAFSAPQLVSYFILFVIGLYADFAGYSKIARGSSQIFGIKLTRNFNHPLFARNFSELWARWHISLSIWFRDYVYFPMNRFLIKKGTQGAEYVSFILPILTAMVASGLWHGLSWNNLIWAVLIAMFQICQKIKSIGFSQLPIAKQSMIKQLIGWAVTAVSSFFAIVFFMTKEPTVGWQFIVQVLTWDQGLLPNLRMFWIILPLLWIEAYQYRANNEFVFLKWSPWSQSALLAIAIVSIYLASLQSKLEPFIYQGF